MTSNCLGRPLLITRLIPANDLSQFELHTDIEIKPAIATTVTANDFPLHKFVWRELISHICKQLQTVIQFKRLLSSDARYWRGSAVFQIAIQAGAREENGFPDTIPVISAKQVVQVQEQISIDGRISSAIMVGLTVTAV